MEIEKLAGIASLIEKYLRGELSSAERQELDEWQEQTEENRLAFQRLCSETFMEQWRTEELLFDGEKAYDRFVKATKKPDGGKRILRYVSAVAALLLLLFGISFVVWNGKKTANVLETAALKPGCPMAKLKLNDGRIMVFTGEIQDTLVEGGVQVLASGSGIEYKVQQKVVTENYNELEVPRNGEFFLLLSDGTKVWVNSETYLRYPVAFNSTERVVEVEGEVYFEVQKDPERPFKVKMKDGGIVEVMGTSFNVRNYPDEKVMQITLEQGHVRLWAGQENLELMPGEQGFRVAGGRLDKKKVNVSLYIGWKEGRFIFKEQPLEEIMRTISRWYDVQVEFVDEKVQYVTFSGNLRRYDHFDKIIKMLEAIKVAKFEVQDHKIHVFEYK